MHPFSTKLDFTNSRKRAHVVAVEPWGHDYTLMPNESLAVIAFGDSAVPWFEFVEWDGSTQIYCEDTIDFKVVQGDIELECGHQRLFE